MTWAMHPSITFDISVSWRLSGYPISERTRIVLIDFHSHIHLMLERRFDLKIDDMIAEIDSNKIFTASNSLDVKSYTVNKALAEQSKFIHPAFGIHPCNAFLFSESVEDWIGFISDRAVIGEIGLDYFFEKDSGKYPAQNKVFSTFLQESKEKILSIHTKGAEEDVLNALVKYRSNRNIPVIHWYSGDSDTLRKMIGQGFYFSIPPEIRYSDKIREIAKAIPITHLLSETDNPGGPHDYLGKPGTPVLIKVVVEELARIKGRSVPEMEQQIETNFGEISRQSGFEVSIATDFS